MKLTGASVSGKQPTPRIGSNKCDECGAPLAPGADCRSQFDLLLGREFEDASLAAVHHLTVMCYTLQHPVAFDVSAYGHAVTWALLREAVSENLSGSELRRRNRARLRQPNRPGILRRSWSTAILTRAPVSSFTVADGVNGPDSEFAARVRLWASTLAAGGRDR